MKLLLHACCGPCSLEPLRLLREEGHDITILFSNANIAPADEYARRLDTLRAWAESESVPVIDDVYEPAAWEAGAGRVGETALHAAGGNMEQVAIQPALREARCRACYRLRFERTAQRAAARGFDAIGTTLSVSPYQFTEVIHEELERAAANAGVAALFEDYRPFYDEATHRSRELGMYRQNYCGCRLSDAEAAAERDLRRRERAAERAARLEEHAAEREAEEAARATRRAERQAYADKQAKKRAALKELRNPQPAPLSKAGRALEDPAFHRHGKCL
ncbi:MAG: epoxyqueuosine reductase QueH [Gordonibacter sp.]|uniref:epoxyqueuosine reductase QueH n=1 Tax=Gordonibacter sp. TaxID=1968902 RepID=UPI00321FA2E3